MIGVPACLSSSNILDHDDAVLLLLTLLKYFVVNGFINQMQQIFDLLGVILQLIFLVGGFLSDKLASHY